MVASQTHDVAVITDQIAKLVVSNANEKEFNGKNEVKARDMKKEQKAPFQIQKKDAKQKKQTVGEEIKKADEWESF
ncbi:MAG: chemotaxis protein, partial [Arcobacter sp.]|jgi:methyl-accepting chemotaxis protein|nr:chemotaxis protein [Arcobacter sp.]